MQKYSKCLSNTKLKAKWNNFLFFNRRKNPLHFVINLYNFFSGCLWRFPSIVKSSAKFCTIIISLPISIRMPTLRCAAQITTLHFFGFFKRFVIFVCHRQRFRLSFILFFTIKMAARFSVGSYVIWNLEIFIWICSLNNVILCCLK